MKQSQGSFTLCGRDISHAGPRACSKAGMSHIPEDRHKHGLILDYTLEENLVLQRYWSPQFHRHGLIKFDEVRRYAEKLIDQYDIRSGQGPVTVARSMSGGNQQKAIVAREIDKDHKLLVAVQPTRGLDVGAIEYIHRRLVAERDHGAAVLLVSLELDEVMNLSDRILVMYEGKLWASSIPKRWMYRSWACIWPAPKEWRDIPHEEIHPLADNAGLLSVMASVTSICIGLLFGLLLLLLLNPGNALAGMGNLLSKGFTDVGNVLYRAAPRLWWVWRWPLPIRWACLTSAPRANIPWARFWPSPAPLSCSSRGMCASWRRLWAAPFGACSPACLRPCSMSTRF